MKRAYFLVIAGGLLAAAAFFLPFVLSQPGSGPFGPGASLLYDFQNTMAELDSARATPVQIAAIVLAHLFEPIGALLFITSGLFAVLWGWRAASVWVLSAAVLNLTFLLWYFSFLYAIYDGFEPGRNFGAFAQAFGSGYWLALIGFALGLVGALLGWQGHPARLRLPGVAALLASIVVTISVFLPSFVPTPQEASVWSLLLLQKNDLLVLWPILLADLLLLVGALLAIIGRKHAPLAMLSGALIGLTFSLLLYSPLLPGFPGVLAQSLGFAYWVMGGGYALGLLGAVIGLMQRPAAPTSSPALPVPSPFP
jgi:hypothetical protein